MKRFSRILVPVDFCPACAAGCRYAIETASACGAELIFLHVIPRYPLSALLLAPVQGIISNAGPALEQEEAAASRRLDEFLEPFPLRGIVNQRFVTGGVPSRRIVEAAGTHRADLLVQGVHASSVLEERVLGSTAEWIIRRSPCPVISVKPDPAGRREPWGGAGEEGGPRRRRARFPVSRILCPTDFSEPSRMALEHALAIARFSEAQLLVLHALGNGDGSNAAEEGKRTEDGSSVLEARLNELRRQAEALYDPDRVQVRVASAGAAASILSLAQAEAVDLVVMGAHGEGNVWRVLVGTTAGSVIRNCPAPVLTVRAGAKLQQVRERFGRVYRKLGPVDLQRLGPEETDFDPEDLGAPEGMKASHLLLNYYGREGVMTALESYGVLDQLRKKGFEEFRLEFDLGDPYRHRLRLHAFSPANGKWNLLIELIVRDDVLTGAGAGAGLAAEFPGPVDAVSVEWLCMQDPTAAFTPDKPPLPGQDHPGLGLGYETFEFLSLMALRLRKGAVLNHPQHYHNARLYHGFFHFLDPVQEGKLIAMIRDTWNTEMADVSWAVNSGCLLDRATGKYLTWTGGAQVCPLDDALKGFFASQAYRERVWRAASRHKFRIDWTRCRERIPSPAGGPSPGPR